MDVRALLAFMPRRRNAPTKEAVREALDWVHQSLAKADETKADAKKLKVILKTDLAILCRRQKC